GSALVAEVQKMVRALRAADVLPLLATLPSAARPPALTRLTAREWEILIRLVGGERVAIMAGDLVVSQSTVRNHLSSIFSKLGVHSQTELVRLLFKAE